MPTLPFGTLHRLRAEQERQAAALAHEVRKGEAYIQTLVAARNLLRRMRNKMAKYEARLSELDALCAMCRNGGFAAWQGAVWCVCV